MRLNRYRSQSRVGMIGRCVAVMLVAAAALVSAGCGGERSPLPVEEQYSDVSPAASPRVMDPQAMPRTPVPVKQPALRDELASSTEVYEPIVENEFKPAREFGLSTFSVDVDTASYANIRRFLTRSTMPPPHAVRVEEMVNYFSYNDPEPDGSDPFAVRIETAGCPWNSKHRLVRIGLQAKRMRPEQRPNSNLVFLLDVSGSMTDPNKLPLVKEAMKLLLDQFGEGDRVSIVTYAGGSEVALKPTPCDDKGKAQIRNALDDLRASGSTNGSAGLTMAYDLAVSAFIPKGVNRVMLCSDGDFNVDITSDNDLVRLIEQRAKSGVFLSVFGFGMYNLKDSKMEKIADKGNGHYGYIDTLNEARKFFVTEAEATLMTIAKDVKIQVDFNPAQVASYRLVGYENRVMRNRDFRDDSKDAGEIGAGHSVTAFYEIEPAAPQAQASSETKPMADPLRYADADPNAKAKADAEAKPAPPAAKPPRTDLLTVRLRYKAPDGDAANEFERSTTDDGKDFASASEAFRFGSSVAAFGMMLRGSKFRGDCTYDAIKEWADSARSFDPFGYRQEFVNLVSNAQSLDPNR